MQYWNLPAMYGFLFLGSEKLRAQNKEASSENGIDHWIGQVRLVAVTIAPKRVMILRQRAE
jgi:hypothetical protein